MVEFRSSLMREKFIIRDPNEELTDEPPAIALSNRFVVPLTDPKTGDKETLVVRAQNMHSCTRMAAAITKEFYDRGLLMNRTAHEVYWPDLWNAVTKGYEKDWNPRIWGCVYHKGRVVFEDGERHPFLDVIEQCDAKNEDSYEAAVLFAEEIFAQAGKPVKIDHDANIAMVISCTEEEAKCGIILRGANRTTTFNYNAKPKEDSDQKIRTPSLLTFSAAFLEGIQLCFQVGMINKKRTYELIEKYSDEDRKADKTVNRLANLNRAISQFESRYWLNYRPDRPDFNVMVKDSEEKALEILKPQIEEMIAEGDLDQGDWVV